MKYFEFMGVTQQIPDSTPDPILFEEEVIDTDIALDPIDSVTQVTLLKEEIVAI